MKKTKPNKLSHDAAAEAALDGLDQAATQTGKHASTVRRTIERQAAELEERDAAHTEALAGLEQALAQADETCRARCADLERALASANEKLRKIAGQIG